MSKGVSISATSPPRGLWWRSHTFFIVVTVGIGAFTDLFLYALIVPVLPFLLRDRIHVPDAEIQSTISNLLAVYAAASCVASPVAGLLADRFSVSRQKPFVFGLLMLAFATVLFAVGQSIPVLVLARCLQGMSGGVVWTLGLTIITETVGHEHLGKAMGTVFSFVSVAALFAPLLGGFLYAKSGYTGVFIVGISMVAFDCLLRLLIVEKKTAAGYAALYPELVAQEPSEQADDEETPLLADTPKKLSRYRLSPAENRFTRSLPILMLFTDPALLTAIWLAFMQAMMFGAIDATIPLVAAEAFGFNSLKAGLLFLPIGAADLLCGPFFGWGVDRYGTKIFASLAFAGLVPSLALLRLPFEPSLVQVLDMGHLIAIYSVLLVFNGAFLSCISSPSIVEAGAIIANYQKANPDIFEQPPYAQLYGIQSMVWSAGLTIGPLFGGALKDGIGYGNMNGVLALICAATTVLSVLYVGEKRDGKKSCGVGGEEEVEEVE